MTKRIRRNFPKKTLEDSLQVPQKIQDEMAGKPFRRLLLADALGIRPSSSNFRVILSSSYKYGLTEGTEKAVEIALTDLGARATQSDNRQDRIAAMRIATQTPEVFRKFYTAYSDRKLPSPEMMNKILVSEFKVPAEVAEECATLIIENGRFCGIIRDIGGSPHVLLSPDTTETVETTEAEPSANDEVPIGEAESEEPPSEGVHPQPPAEEKPRPHAIFIGHGKKKEPLNQLQKILSSFQIPHKVAVEEPSLGRPISQKVKDIMEQCGSAILIFSSDEKFFDAEGNEIWRPSENVVHELGAASYAYEDRVVIFKEKGLHFPTNYQNIGYIEFSDEGLKMKTTELLKELIGFGLVKITTT